MRQACFLIFAAFTFFTPVFAAEEPASPPPEDSVLEEALPEDVSTFLGAEVAGFTMAEILLSFVIVLVTLVFRNILAKAIFKAMRRAAARTRVTYDERALEAIEKPLSHFILALGLYLAVMALPFDEEWRAFLGLVFRGVSVFFVFWALLRLVDVGAEVLADLSKQRESSLTGFLPLFKKSLRVFLFILGAVMVFDNLGYSIGGIIAGLGIGGAAFAFAAKDTIANLYGSIALALDRPFRVGDWIQVGDAVDGDVEEIGLRSTKVRTWPKTVLSIPNAVLANEMINNWSRMPKRRVKQYVGVTYQSSPEDMEGLVEDIRTLLKEDEGVQQDFILVNFTDFGDSSLQILVYYFTQSTAWLEHLEVRQRINCKIMRAIRERGLSIAFPTRTLYFEGDIARQMAGATPPDREGRLPGDFGPSEPQ